MESGSVGGDLAIGYVVGFIDADASFSVSIKYPRGYGLRLDPVFSITQINRQPLDVIHGVINAGRIIKKPGQKHLHLYIVDNIKELTERLIPFLDKHRHLLYSKGKAYGLFREIVITLSKGKHREKEEMRRLLTLAYELSHTNPKSRRKRTLEEVLKLLDNPPSNP
jgi:hypothetical protein